MLIGERKLKRIIGFVVASVMLVMSLRVVHCEETPRFVKVCAGTLYAVALNDAGELWAWGENKNGQLGVAPCEEITEPVKILDNIKIPEMWIHRPNGRLKTIPRSKARRYF